ncbi:MAG TPA: hypothetical protein VJL90_01495 [Pseudorhodoplanes sp.]|nr:hypothetical protein [Pseudorhodoplanes sp.]
MFRVTLGLATATFIALAASPASAGCCGSNWGWGGGWGVNSFGCCNGGYAYQQAPVVYQQPQYYVQPAAPIVVQAPPQQVIVQQSQPEVIFQQAAVAPVPTYTVNHGPYYSGPETIGYSQPQYYADQPVRPYPYVSGGYYKPRYYGRPYSRVWRDGYRPYRHYGVYRGAYRGRVYGVGRYGVRHPVARAGYVKRHWN